MLFHAGESRFISVQGQQFEGVPVHDGYIVDVPAPFAPHMEVAGLRAVTNEADQPEPVLAFVRARARARSAVEMDRARQIAVDTPWARAFGGQ